MKQRKDQKKEEKKSVKYPHLKQYVFKRKGKEREK